MLAAEISDEKLTQALARLMKINSPFHAQLSSKINSIFCGIGDAVKLAMVLGKEGYKVSVRSAKGSSFNHPVVNKTSTSCFHNLRHEFLLVRGDEGIEYVVDLAFRDQFEIPHPTDAYQEVLKAVPQVFVGPMASLVALVQLLGDQMAQVFTSNGLALPPWRRTSSLLTKWASDNVIDRELPSSTRSDDLDRSVFQRISASQSQSQVDSMGGGSREFGMMSDSSWVSDEPHDQLFNSESLALETLESGSLNSTHHPRKSLRRGLLSQSNISQSNITQRAHSLDQQLITEFVIHKPLIPGMPRIITVKRQHPLGSSQSQEQLIGSSEVQTLSLRSFCTGHL